ncbi:hypothetical protein Csa_015565 [Cucumis sativus]|uniref:Uncharacterized protein n=1 Tax=Cucumis sativus TaxID=3659 RepID=A0A0A0K9T7_CUCSA|nr:hypothetical protein Csa_015565 [Cucumis sativus]
MVLGDPFQNPRRSETFRFCIPHLTLSFHSPSSSQLSALLHVHSNTLPVAAVVAPSILNSPAVFLSLTTFAECRLPSLFL